MTGLTITVSGTETPVYTSEAGLRLLPNRDETVAAKIPTGTAIENTDYTITAAFADGTTVVLNDTLYLDIPDVGISRVSTVEESNGQRVLRCSLYNALSAKLADGEDNWRVKVGFYADSDCTTPLKDADGKDLVLTIDEQSDLALIDAGGYSTEVTLPVHIYMTDEADGLQEIPASGIPVYVEAWVEVPADSTPSQTTRSPEAATEYDKITEYFAVNNSTSLLLDSLAQRRGEDVTLQTQLDNSGDVTKATVTVQYNKLTGTTSGNLIVTLLDADGQPLEKLQSYSTDGLLDLSMEEIVEKTFTFTQKGASVKAEFSDLILNESSVELDHVSLTGAEVSYDPATKTYTATGANLTSGILEIAPKDPMNAAITLDGKTYDITKTSTISLPYGTTEWEIVVTNGANTETYLLVLNNSDTRTSGGGSSHTITVTEDVEHGSVTVNRKRAPRGQTVTITATPDEGYKVGTVTVTEENGKTVAVTDKGEGVYTFTMPASDVEIRVTFVPEHEWTNPFSDVPADAWFYDAVRYVSEHGLMNGYGADLFGPNDVLTRAQLAQVLYNLENRPGLEDALLGYPFADVPGESWFADAVYWARLQGIVNGYSGEQFGPEDPITREQLAVMLYRYAQYKGYDTTASGGLSSFPDQSGVASWAREAVTWAVGHGLIAGMGDGTLSPQGDASRAQIATVLMRFVQNMASDT